MAAAAAVAPAEAMAARLAELHTCSEVLMLLQLRLPLAPLILPPWLLAPSLLPPLLLLLATQMAALGLPAQMATSGLALRLTFETATLYLAFQMVISGLAYQTAK